MIINDIDAAKRLSSPMNLINKLKSLNGNGKKNNAMSLFGIGKKEEKVIKSITSFNPFEEIKKESTPLDRQPVNTNEELAKLDNIIENHESHIKLGLAHDRALDLLNRSVDMLSTKLDEVNASKLPAVISAASKTVESIRRERSEAAKNNKDREVHYHFYTPEQKKLSEYEVIDVA